VGGHIEGGHAGAAANPGPLRRGHHPIAHKGIEGGIKAGGGTARQHRRIGPQRSRPGGKRLLLGWLPNWLLS
jgi:hypothetical protein